MNKQQRIDLLIKLGDYITSGSETFADTKQQASYENPWFLPGFIETALQNIACAFLNGDNLIKWLGGYNIPEYNKTPKSVGIVMAGNIPLVGFHDLLCVFISGHKAIIKPSSKDSVLIKHLTGKMAEWAPETEKLVVFAENLKGCDAHIATGSNNSARYFDYYFGKYPNIIRRNRTSAAVANGRETPEELSLLADDIQLYFGMGCRNVTKLYVPEGYDFLPVLEALRKYDYFYDFHKYRHNYDYHLALLLMNQKYYMTNGSVILTENPSPFSPVSQVHYEFYNDLAVLKETLQNNNDIQCIVGNHYLPFGQAQSPSLVDYADGIDTMAFLTSL